MFPSIFGVLPMLICQAMRDVGSFLATQGFESANDFGTYLGKHASKRLEIFNSQPK